jgi:hypothetical protein
VVPVPGTVPAGFADVVVTANGVSSNAQSFLVIPTIEQASSQEEIVGTPITLTGTSFGGQQGSSTVAFGSVPATPTSWSNSSITAPVPLGAGNGFIVVTVNGFATNGVPFDVLPNITNLSPGTGAVASPVTISGSGFGAAPGFGGVTFNGVSATVTAQGWSDTSISTTVPPGATTGNVVVTASSLFSSSGVNFTVGASLVSLSATPSGPTLYPDTSQQFRATGTLSDGTTSDYTTKATWNSSNDSVVSVSNATGGQGLALVRSAGTANITATVGSVSGTTTVTVQTPATPAITGISPSSGGAGTQVTITGSGFGAAQGNGRVLLGSILGTVVSWSDGQVVAAVAPGSTSGSVEVLQAGLVSNSVTFTVVTPAITSITPTSGVAGTQVSISGSGFGSAQGSGKVWLGSTYGTVVSWSDAQIAATVAPNAASGTAQVQQGGTWSNSVSFSVNGATITNVTPTSGLPGTQVTITGSGFGTAQGSGNVWLGTAYGTVVGWSDNQVVANVATGSTSGVAQILQNGVLSNAVSFTVNVPQITGVSPTSGAAGTTVTMTGSGFGASQGSSGIVWVGSTNGIVVTWSDSQVQASVAPNAVGGIVRIQQNGIWSNAVRFTVPPTFSGGPSIVINPNLLSMVVGDTLSLQALNTSGQPATGLSWASSDTTIATLSTDDPPIVTAVAPGHVTITAGNASADLTVYPGPTLPPGTVHWSVPDDGSGVSKILPAVPSNTGIDVFAVQGDNNVQAVTTDGRVAWTTNVVSQNSFLRFLPDFLGGLITVTVNPSLGTGSITRLDGVTGQLTLIYTFKNPDVSPINLDEEERPVRLFTDGTILTIDGDAVIGIDPQTGTLKFSIQLDHSTASAYQFCDGGSSGFDLPPNIGTFIIAGDSYAYLVYRHTSDNVALFDGDCHLIIHDEEHTKVLRVGSSGDWSKIAVADWTMDADNFIGQGTDNQTQSGVKAVPGNLITNADQGVLLPVDANSGGYCAEINSFGETGCIPASTTHNLVSISPNGVSSVSMNLPGQTGPVTPILQGEDGTFFGTFPTQQASYMTAFDQSGTVKWSVPNYTPLMATADGGVIAQSPAGTSVSFDDSGNISGQQANSGAAFSWTGQWYEGGAGTSAVRSPLIYLDGASFWPQAGGNPSGNGVGIVLCPCLLQTAAGPTSSPSSIVAGNQTTSLVLVGDPGLNTVDDQGHVHSHNVGSLFVLSGETLENSLGASGINVVNQRVSSASDFSNALATNGLINGTITFFGHAGVDRHGNSALFPGEQAGDANNISILNVGQLSNAHLGPNVTITLNACHAGLGDKNSVAQQIAVQLKRKVFAYKVDLYFSSDPTPRRFKKGMVAPSGIPTYMVPNGDGLQPTQFPLP